MADEKTSTPHVMFRLGKQAFALLLSDVKDVAKTPDITPVPNTEPMVRGLCVLRDNLTTALDLRLRFNLPASNDPNHMTALAIDHEGERIALLVDKVEDVAILPPLSQVAPPKDPLWQDVVNGVTRFGDETIIVLDAAGIIDGVLEKEEAEPEDA